MKNKDVLVTGGAGFIGSHITKKLLSAGANVSVVVKYKSIIDNKTENKPGKIKATFQPKISTKAPAVKAPKPIPTPPNIPLIPNAFPAFE